MRRPSKIFLFYSVGLTALAAAYVLICLYLRSSRKTNNHSGYPAFSQVLQSNDPGQILAEADRLALLANWTKAGPLFARAEQIYTGRGEQRNALYSKIGRQRSDLEKTSYSEVGRAISEDMKNPLVGNDPRLKLKCLTAKGVIDMNINTPAAKNDWTEVMVLAKSLDDRIWQERATGWLGILAFIDGKTARAGAMVTEAIVRANLLHDSAGEADFISYLGEGLNEFHRPQRALDLFNRALAIAASTPDMGIPYHVYIGKVSALEELNRRQEAQAVLNFALDEARRAGILGAQADLLREDGELAVDNGNFALARTYYEDCASVSERGHLTRLLADAMFKLTNLYQQGGDLTRAEQCVERGIQAVRQVEAPYQLPHYLGVEAELKESMGRYQDADVLFSEAADLVEAMLLSVSSSTDASSLIGIMSEVYVGHFRLAAMFLQDNAKAFKIVERARGRVMLDALRTNRAVPEEGLAQLTPAEFHVVDLQRELRQPHSSTERQALLDQLEDAEANLKHTEYDRFRSREFIPPEPVDLSTLRRSLRPDEMIMEYVLDDPMSFCLVITREAVRIQKLGGREQINALANAYLAEIKAKRSAEPEAKKLFSSLIEPVLDGNPKRYITIISDGRLNGLPFDALVMPTGQFLLDSHIITYAPSSTVFHLLRVRASQSASPLPFLGVAYDQNQPLIASKGALWKWPAEIARGFFDLQGSSDPPPLPYAREEVTSIASLAGPNSVVLSGQAATEEKLKSEPLGGFEVLHFAVHGFASTAEPERSALVLRTDPHSKEDGLWQAREIRRESLHAELVTLSGCDTGVGKTEGEEGTANLVRAFLLAGARNVVSTSFPADDRFTAELMKQFYKHLSEGMEEGEALNRAKVDILSEFGPQTPPYYWAGFSLVGAGNGHVSFPRSK
ncbi:MAG: CHAT domain-containing protein [Terriglobia bacterium]|jgi:CHAT domain-containing protein